VGNSRELRIGSAIPTEPPLESELSSEPELTPWKSVLVTTSHELPGARIVRHRGEVFGITVRTRNTFANAIASVRGIVGGEVGSYTKLMVMARHEALHRLRQEADAIDANAVVSMRLTANQISEDMTEIVAYGAAVVIERTAGPADDDDNSAGA
jgi:uncharacterized protein YbjQ (UPF0145 family)